MVDTRRKPLHRLESSFPDARRASMRDRLASPIDGACLDLLSRGLSGIPVRIALWNGRETTPVQGTPVATIRFRDRATLLRVLLDSDVAFGEAYADGGLEIEGDMVGFLTSVARRAEAAPRGGPFATIRRFLSTNTPERSRYNAHRHYDLGNDFYRSWLDSEMVYTCAYYPHPDATLEEAQLAKLDHVARKLALSPGEMVYEAGCGWGALACHLASRYGVRVRAWNLSHEQVAWARERAQRDGLASRVEFIEDDYRSISGHCDAFVSVGMLEHVGRRQHAALGEVIDRSLDAQHGRGLLHFIGRNAPKPTGRWIQKHIFPGGYLPSLGEALTRVLEPRRFSIVDVENLRLHYAQTLAAWLSRFDAVSDQVAAQFGPRFVRTWRLYLAGSQAGFLGGYVQLFQVTFARASQDRLPITRAHLYR
jgi:cyclopropane-fatty-acyl-phospholipid synthase